jgi:hypothetical protein
MTRRALALAALLLLVAPAAEAGEAWVVWINVATADRSSYSSWAPHSAYQSLSACEYAIVYMHAKRSNLELLERDGATILDHGNPIKLRTREGTMFTILSRCFPDTIDPRERQAAQ